MPSRRILHLAGAVFSLISFVNAQGVLVNGNSNLPDCAKQCTLLKQAAEACSGTTSASQQVWSCFCQSGYLTNLRSSASGICDQFCTNPTDNQQVSTWYSTNCGNDNGATEHADNGNANNANNAQGATTSTPTTVATASPGSSSSGSGGGGGDWLSSHYQWIIMVIVLIIGLSALGWFLTWLRRRWERKQDQTTNGFNAGVTTQVAPRGHNATQSYASNPRFAEPPNGRDSAARTRDSFMPYGYGYNRSDSRLESQHSGVNDRRSPLPQSGTPMTDREKEIGVDGDITGNSSDNEINRAPPPRSLARDRSAAPSPAEGEKF